MRRPIPPKHMTLVRGRNPVESVPPTAESSRSVGEPIAVLVSPRGFKRCRFG